MAKDLGDQLRHARQARGLSLEDLAASTKIPVSALHAIEDEAFDRLPGGIFRRAYLRTFAAEVGLDADQCVQWYVARWEPPPPPEPESRLASWSDTHLRALLSVLIAVGLFAAMSLVGKLWRFGTSDGAPHDPARASGGGTTSSAAPQPASAGASSALRLQIQVTDVCWISATADDVSAVRRLVPAGETVTIDASTSIVLHLGNPGAVTYTINGERGRALGKGGKPVTVRITPKMYDALLAGATP